MKKRSLLLYLLGLLLIAIGVLTLGKQPEPFPENSQSSQWLAPGVLTVASEKVSLVDSSRPTNANGDYAGANSRTLEGKLWYPKEDQGPYPLVVYSHGFTSTWKGGAYLGEHLASLGYVVIATSYPLSNYAAPGGPTPKDVVNQPGDVSFLIDSLIRRSEDEKDILFGKVDASRVGVTGISLGGLTTELVAFHPTKRDPRIGAALSIAGPTMLFTETFFTHASVPFLMLAGDIDALIPHATNALPVLDKVPAAQLVTLTGGSHTGFAGPAAPLRWLSNPDAIGCFMVKRNVEDEPPRDEQWYNLFGTQEQGINYAAKDELCLVDPLPKAMNVLRQQMITTIVVSSFFESIFANTKQRREKAAEFLSQTMTTELQDVSYARQTN